MSRVIILVIPYSAWILGKTNITIASLTRLFSLMRAKKIVRLIYLPWQKPTSKTETPSMLSNSLRKAFKRDGNRRFNKRINWLSSLTKHSELQTKLAWTLTRSNLNIIRLCTFAKKSRRRRTLWLSWKMSWPNVNQVRSTAYSCSQLSWKRNWLWSSR